MQNRSLSAIASEKRSLLMTLNVLDEFVDRILNSWCPLDTASNRAGRDILKTRDSYLIMAATGTHHRGNGDLDLNTRLVIDIFTCAASAAAPYGRWAVSFGGQRRITAPGCHIRRPLGP